MQNINALRIDASTVCQLNCPCCPNPEGLFKDTCVGYGTLSIDNFKKIVMQLPGLDKIELSNYGEVFLNKDLLKILAFAHAKGIAIDMSNGVNLNTATEEQLKAVVKYRVKHIVVSIDGTTQETYSRYRKKGNIGNVFKHIETINHYKKLYGSEEPKLTWQYIAFSYNVKQIPIAKSMALGEKMDFFLKKNWDTSFDQLNDNDLAAETELSLEWKTAIEKKRAPIDPEKYPFCLQLWLKQQINWNGEVLGCCVNFWQSYGNALKSDLTEILKTTLYLKTKDMLIGKAFITQSPCWRCDIFLSDIYPRYRTRYFMISPFNFLFKLFIEKRLRKIIFRLKSIARIK